MNRICLVILTLLFISIEVDGQKIIYGVNLDKTYSDINEHGTENIQKEVILKDKSLYYFVKISFNDFIFGAIGNNEHTVFDAWNYPQKYYQKGLNDIKKVFGKPINIYLDTSFTKTTTDFYIWKVKRNEGYFLVFYSIGYANRGLTFNVYKKATEKDVNSEILNDVNSEQSYRNEIYYLKYLELNIKDFN